MPSYGEDPKKDMSQYETYSFKGWDPAIAPASCNITYKATYDTSVSEDEFTVLFEPNGGDDFYVSLTKRKGEPLTLPSEQPHRRAMSSMVGIMSTKRRFTAQRMNLMMISTSLSSRCGYLFVRTAKVPVVYQIPYVGIAKEKGKS